MGAVGRVGWAAGLVLLAGCPKVQGAGGDAGAGASPPGKVAILLPEAKTARYESHDLPLLRAKLVSLGVPAADILYMNANQDVGAQRQQAEAALTNGATVLVLDPVDSDAAAAVADLAQARGASVIAYDRLVKGSAAVRYYVSFDNEEVGRLQGRALLEALQGTPDPAVVMVNGSPTDNNAAAFKRGAHAVLDGKVRVVKEYDTPDWSPDKAQLAVQQALTALGNKVDGIYAANDGTAGGAIAAMKGAGLAVLPPVTGQDAELAAVQRIVTGEQHVTVYKAIRPEAEAAAILAHALLRGQPPPAGLVNGTTPNGKIDVPSVLLSPVAVTRANVMDTVVKDRFWSVAEICAGEVAAACARAGLR